MTTQNLGGVFQGLGPYLVPGFGVQAVATTILNTDTYTPDLRKGAFHRLNLTNTGAGNIVTIGRPILFAPLPTGWAPFLTITFFNGTGNAEAILWDAAFTSISLPATISSGGARRTVSFLLDQVSNVWVPVGALA
jgi:hypothetical protein